MIYGNEWRKTSKKDLMDHDIIALVSWDDSINNEDIDARMTGQNCICHSEGVKALAEWQGEETATNVMLLRCWHNLTTRRRSKLDGKFQTLIFCKQFLLVALLCMTCCI